MSAKLARNKVTVGAALAVVFLSVFAYFVVLSPQKNRASELEAEIATTQAELQQLRADRAAVTEAPPPPAGDISELDKAIPDETNMPDVMLQLAGVARESGISFDSITPGEPVAGSGYQKVPISLVFQGNFFELSDFLYRLRNLVQLRENRLSVDGRLFAVDAIDFAQGTKQFPHLQATVTASAFVYGGAPAATPPAVPTPEATGSAAGATP